MTSRTTHQHDLIASLTFAGVAPPPTCCGAQKRQGQVTPGCRGYRRVERQPVSSDPWSYLIPEALSCVCFSSVAGGMLWGLQISRGKCYKKIPLNQRGSCGRCLCDHAPVPCVREVSEALRPSWKLAAGRLPCAWGRRWEERARGPPAGSWAPPLASETRSVDISPRAACNAGAGLDEDFRQLSDEAPSEGLTTIPKDRAQKLDSTAGRVKNLHVSSLMC